MLLHRHTSCSWKCEQNQLLIYSSFTVYLIQQFTENSEPKVPSLFTSFTVKAWWALWNILQCQFNERATLINNVGFGSITKPICQQHVQLRLQQQLTTRKNHNAHSFITEKLCNNASFDLFSCIKSQQELTSACIINIHNVFMCNILNSAFVLIQNKQPRSQLRVSVLL